MKLRFSLKRLILCLLVFVAGALFMVGQIWAQECSSCSDPSNELDCNKEKIACWEDKIDNTQAKANTLTNTITLLNGQISLQQLQINQTLAEISQLEGEIDELTERIEGLGYSLDRLSTVLIKRARTEFKQSRVIPCPICRGADTLTDLIRQIRYLSIAQQQTADTMERTETQRLAYDEQKTLKEEKQAQLDAKRATLQGQQATLEQQKKDQQFLLTQTKNDEAKYQEELAKTLAETAAIQSIIAGKGLESEVKDVNQGDLIANLIVGPSTCSTNTHLHFEVAKGGYHEDPAKYLKSISITWNNNDGSFGFSGNWEWPLDNPAIINQGFGLTSYARVGSYGYYSNGNPKPHTGIDMNSKSFGNYTVRAVRPGTLYRGSISCGGGLLRYVRVDHKDDAEDTFYLHVNY
jgi:peptidoglycan hydrolase CwlO-like protein